MKRGGGGALQIIVTNVAERQKLFVVDEQRLLDNANASRRADMIGLVERDIAEIKPMIAVYNQRARPVGLRNVRNMNGEKIVEMRPDKSIGQRRLSDAAGTFCRLVAAEANKRERRQSTFAAARGADRAAAAAAAARAAGAHLRRASPTPSPRHASGKRASECSVSSCV